MKTRSDMITLFVVRPAELGASHEFLQLHRESGDYLGNTWQLVRGTVEASETATQGALRELKEETGLVPDEMYRLASVESFYLPHDDTLWHSVAFLAIVSRAAQVVLNEEHDAHRWVGRERMMQEMMWASERMLFPDLCRDVLDQGAAKPYLKVAL
ncbi:MAG TPA: NUDIX domain-containing protein [Tepidisphaeraceae bacterium]|jgi:dATP pyrophosphohydrolase